MEEIPAYGSSIKNNQAPRREREREREHARAEASNGVHTSRREYTRDSEEGDDSEGTLLPGLACPALLCSAPLRSAPCSVSSSGSTPVLSLFARPALSRAFVERNTGESFRRERERTSANRPARFSRVKRGVDVSGILYDSNAIEPSSPIWNILN